MTLSGGSVETLAGLGRVTKQRHRDKASQHHHQRVMTSLRSDTTVDPSDIYGITTSHL
jgi:hypothetical protein